MAEYVIYKYVFTKTDEINLFKQTEEGERIVLSAQEICKATSQAHPC